MSCCQKDSPAPRAHGGGSCCGGDKEEGGENWKILALSALASGVLGVAGTLLRHGLFAVPDWAPVACYTLAMVAGGWDALLDSIRDLPRGKVTIHFLMLLGAVGAAVIGAWGEAVLLLFLFMTSEALEAFVAHRTRRAIDSLFKDQPKTATLLDADGAETVTAVEDIRAGDLLLARPGDIFPVDATVESGESAADESSLTGEALPAPKKAGDEVFGGTLNLWGAVRVRALRPAAESSRQKIIRLIQEAQARKAPSQRFTDTFGRYYTLPVLILVAGAFLYWWLGCDLPPFFNGAADAAAPAAAHAGHAHGAAGTGTGTGAENLSAFYRAMTLLVVLCPCALVLSIPSAILAAIAWGARRGILFRGGAAVEKLAAVGVFAFDKTGTLTTGELAVEDVLALPAGRAADALRLAAALEAGASHPIAKAIVRAAAEKEKAAVAVGAGEGAGASPAAQQPPAPIIGRFENLSGFGVKGVADGLECVLGRRELFDGTPLAEWADALPAAPDGQTEVWLIARPLAGTGTAGAEPLLARFLLRDQPREKAAPVLAALRAAGVRTLMLTGDRAGAAESIGKTLGVGEVRAGLTPAQKVAAIRSLGEQGQRVAMVGDGVNDAPCLAAAAVAIGMGARGSDAALEQCDVVLMHDRLERILDARALSGRARRVIRLNLAISLGTIAVMAVMTFGVELPLSLGVVAHEGSTFIVCLNGLRLLFTGGGKTRPVS
ncbi:MAG: cation-translocating P-type ATPase [Puniceicoccales bacterium]|jgi:Cd2+/Zn2+-exporting ATPase|nr:cation-translocating P-type ATPase [Puniceicoccales bacterium]